MNIAEKAIHYKVITLMFVFLIIGGGYVAFNTLGRLEDPEFTIKTAKVVTLYPGATPRETEEEVTEVLETEIQKMSQLKDVTTETRAGYSSITVDIKDEFGRDKLPQVWDELRRKIGDAQKKLPPGAGPSLVIDDFGDVYGILVAIYGEGFSNSELRDIADKIRDELLQVKDVAKIDFTGVQNEVVYIEIPSIKLAQLGISRQAVKDAIVNQNLVTDSGSVKVGDEFIRIDPTGTFTSVSDIGDLFISVPESAIQIRLKDIAVIKRGYQDPPTTIVRYNGKPAITLGVSTAPGGDVVRMGNGLKEKFRKIQEQIPVGVEFGVIYLQSEQVTKAVNNFMINLLEALAIVIIVLVIFMGFRSGMIIASILLLTIFATLAIMKVFGITLQRISLGALIIALGMLVDNAIVITDGILVRIEQGMDRIKAAAEVVGQTMWPLLGATVVAILAFAPIGLSPDNTGEYCASLFQVILISLLMSWLLAITVAPLFCKMWIKIKKEEQGKDPYAGKMYQKYVSVLKFCLGQRWKTTGAVVGLLFLGIFGFMFVDKTFFPPNPLPLFYIDFWEPQGTSIKSTERDIGKLYEHLEKDDRLKFMASFVGSGAPRFMLTYTPEGQNDSYGYLLVGIKDEKQKPAIMSETEKYLTENFPNVEAKVMDFMLGAGGSGGKVEVRFSGPDANVLRSLADEAKKIFHADGGAKYIRDDWRQRVKVIRPQFDEVRARQVGISRPQLNEALAMTFEGVDVGLYREGKYLLPIITRAPENERLDVNKIREATIWSPGTQSNIPISQVVSGFETESEDAMIQRRNRKRTITAQADPISGTVSALQQRVSPLIVAMGLPVGYSMEWGGEYEDSKNAQAGLSRLMPLIFMIIIVLLIVMFNALKQPAIILLCCPLAIVGVTVGLLLFQKSFSFMAVLGFLSLIGMLIKNGVVLIDEMDLQRTSGKDPYKAIVDACVSRFRPVLMAAVTTVFGMIPLLQDIFFVDMAVTIMFGLAFATGLTLIVVPVFYEIFFKIPSPVTNDPK